MVVEPIIILKLFCKRCHHTFSSSSESSLSFAVFWELRSFPPFQIQQLQFRLHCPSPCGLGAAPFSLSLSSPLKCNPANTTSVASKDMTDLLPSPLQKSDADFLLLCQLEEVCIGNFSRPDDASDFSEAGCMEGLQLLEISLCHSYDRLLLYYVIVLHHHMYAPCLVINSSYQQHMARARSCIRHPPAL